MDTNDQAFFDDTEGMDPSVEPLISVMAEPNSGEVAKQASVSEASGMAPESVRQAPQLASRVARENQLRQDFKDLDSYPQIKEMLLSGGISYVAPEHIDPLKRYHDGLASFTDNRPELGWATSTAHYVRQENMKLVRIAASIPAIAEKGFTGKVPEWWSDLNNYTERENDLINEFKVGTMQAIAGQTVASFASVSNIVTAGVAGVAAKAGKAALFANRADKTYDAMRMAQGGADVAKTSVKNALSGAALVTGAYSFVGSVEERAKENIQKGVSPYLSPSDTMWISANAIVQGALELAGPIGELGFLTSKPVGKSIVENIGGNFAQESAQSLSESVLLDFGMREKEVTGQNVGEAFAGATIEGVAGAAIGALNLPFDIRDAIVNGPISTLAKAANDVKRLEGLAQATVGIGPMAKKVELHTRDYINSQLNTTGKDRVFFSAEDWKNYWQSKNVNDQQMFNKFRGEATSDGLISVPVADFILNANRDKTMFAELMDIVRPSREGYNLHDAAKLVDDLPSEIENIVKREVDKAGKIHGDVTDDSANIVEDVKAKLKDAKVPVPVRQQGAQLATMTAVYYRTLADDMNRAYGTSFSPSELYNKYGVVSYGTETEIGKRGSYDGKNRSVAFTRRADGSTVTHEIGHHFLDVRSKILSEHGVDNEVFINEQASFSKWIGDNAQQVIDSYIERLPQEIRDQVRKDLAIIGGAKFIKKNADRLHEIDNYHAYAAIHEYFARGFELYMSKGKAPSAETRSLFHKFMGWISKAYGNVKNLLGSTLGVNLTPDGVRYMDRMLASQKAIDAELELNRYGSIVDLIRESGSIPLEHVDDLLSKTEASRELIREKMLETVSKRLKESREEDRNDLRAMIRNDVRAELNSNDNPSGRLYNLISEMIKGTRLDGSPNIGVANGKFNYSDVESLLGKPLADKLKKWGMTTDAGDGVNLVETISKVGYDDPQAFGKDMLGLSNYDSVLDATVAQRLNEQFAEEDFSDSQLRIIARELITSGDMSQEVLDMELSIILEEYAKSYEKGDIKEQASRELNWAVAQVKAHSEEVIVNLSNQLKTEKVKGRWDIARERTKSKEKYDSLKAEYEHKLKTEKVTSRWDIAEERTKFDEKLASVKAKMNAKIDSLIDKSKVSAESWDVEVKKALSSMKEDNDVLISEGAQYRQETNPKSINSLTNRIEHLSVSIAKNIGKGSWKQAIDDQLEVEVLLEQIRIINTSFRNKAKDKYDAMFSKLKHDVKTEKESADWAVAGIRKKLENDKANAVNRLKKKIIDEKLKQDAIDSEFRIAMDELRQNYSKSIKDGAVVRQDRNPSTIDSLLKKVKNLNIGIMYDVKSNRFESAIDKQFELQVTLAQIELTNKRMLDWVESEYKGKISDIKSETKELIAYNKQVAAEKLVKITERKNQVISRLKESLEERKEKISKMRESDRAWRTEINLAFSKMGEDVSSIVKEGAEYRQDTEPKTISELTSDNKRLSKKLAKEIKNGDKDAAVDTYLEIQVTNEQIKITSKRMLDWAESRWKGKLEDLKAHIEKEKSDLAEYRRFHKRVMRDTVNERNFREGVIKFKIANTPINNLIVTEYTTAANKAAEKARVAFIDGKLEEAFEHKRRETDLRFTANHAREVLEKYYDTYKKIISYSTNPTIRKKLREGASIHVRVGDKQYLFADSNAVSDFIKDKPEAVVTNLIDIVDGIVANFAASVVKTDDKNGDTIRKRSTLSMQEVKVVEDQLDGLVRDISEYNRHLNTLRKHNVSDTADDLMREAGQNAPANPPNQKNPINQILGFAVGSGLRLSSYINTLDGGKIGSWTKNILYNIQEKNTRANDLHDSLCSEFSSIAKSTNLYDYSMGLFDKNNVRTPVGTTKYTLNVQERRTMMLMLGSVTGRQRVIEHLKVDGVTDQETVIAELLRTATNDDINYVKGIYAQNAKIKESVDNAMRLTGEAPASDIALLPITFGEGDNVVQLEGGYVTIKYEKAGLQTTADMWEIISNGGAFSSMRPSDSQTESRAETVEGRKLNLTAEVHLNHLREASRIIELMGFAKDMTRLFKYVNGKNRGILIDIASQYGESFAKELEQHILFAVTGPPSARNETEKIISKFRANASVAALAGNITAIIKQPAGILNALGHKDMQASNLANTLIRFSKNRRAMYEFVRSKSSAMNDRTTVFNESSRDIHDVAVGNPPIISAISKFGMSPYAITQGMIDVPTWACMYEIYSERFKDEGLAIQAADQFVRNVMGSGETTEMTALHRNQWSRLLTMFGNFNITQLNQIYKASQEVYNERSLASVIRLLGNLWWTVIMAAITNYVMDWALKGNDEGFMRGKSASNFIGSNAMKAMLDMSPMTKMVSEIAIGDSKNINVAAFRPLANAGKIVGEFGQATFGENRFSDIDPIKMSNMIFGSVGAYIGLPSGLINRTVEGIAEGDPRMVIFGKPQQSHR